MNGLIRPSKGGAGFCRGTRRGYRYGIFRQRPARTGRLCGLSSSQDCGSGAHGERRFWELPPDDERDGGTPGVDRLKAELVRREVARQIDEMSRFAGDVSPGWRRWARATLAPKVDYMATIRHAVRRALRDSTLGPTTARTGGRIGGRPATASSSCPASISRARGPGF